MRVPDPIANTTTEAYLAYKAGYLVEEELKPVLYDPIYHYDAWLAYWCSLVNSYPTKANGDPEILTDEEALVAFLSGVTNTYPEKIKDPYNVRVVGYLKYLVSIRFGRPEYPITNEEFYLSMIKPAVVTNSTPSSDIQLDNTVQGAFLSASIFGDTTQQTYSGKNLLKLSGRTNSGVTGTVNADGSYTISGTGTTTDGVSVFTFNGVLPAGTYTLSLSKALPKVINLSPENDVALRIPAGSTSATVTITKEYTSASVFFGIENGVSYDETFNMQLVAGETPDYDFEPYVGGMPSPNPDYPQNVNVVTGEQTVNVSGKNLFNSYIATKPSWQAGNLVVNTDGSITLSGNTGSNEYFQLEQTLGTLCPNLQVGDEVYLYLDTTSKKKSIYISPRVVWANGDTKTITQSMLDGPVVIYGGYNQADTLKIMVTRTQETTFEPYVAPQNYTINLGSIELCKIGTYQDYIYKGDNGWYVHKEVKHLSLPVANMDNTETYPGWKNKITATEIGGSVNGNLASKVPYYVSVGAIGEEGPDVSGNYSVGCNSRIGLILLPRDYYGSDFTQTYWTTNYPNLAVELYHGIVSSVQTDTLITDSTLVGQLESLLQGGSYNGTTYITVTANGDNLPGLLQVEAGEYR